MKLLAFAVLLISCTKSIEAPTYSDTWAGNAANQVFTFKALKNAQSTGYIYYDGSAPDTREVYTKNDVSTYPISVLWYDGGWDISGTFTDFPANKAITRAEIEGTIALSVVGNNTIVVYLPPGKLHSDIAVGMQLYSNRSRTTTYAPGIIVVKTWVGQEWTINTFGIITAINNL